MSKKFEEPHTTVVYTTKFVVEDKKDITIVIHFEGGSWHFCSNNPDENFQETARGVELGQIISLDESVLQIADLPEGYGAQRKFKNDAWRIALLPE